MSDDNKQQGKPLTAAERREQAAKEKVAGDKMGTYRVKHGRVFHVDLELADDKHKEGQARHFEKGEEFELSVRDAAPLLKAGTIIGSDVEDVDVDDEQMDEAAKAAEENAKAAARYAQKHGNRKSTVEPPSSPTQPQTGTPQPAMGATGNEPGKPEGSDPTTRGDKRR